MKLMIARRTTSGVVFYPAALAQTNLDSFPCTGRLAWQNGESEFIVEMPEANLQLALTWLEHQEGVYRENAGFFINLQQEASAEAAG